jgi:hypothetical protein
MFVQFRSASRPRGRGRSLALAIPLALASGLTALLSMQMPPIQPQGNNPGRQTGRPKKCPVCKKVVRPDWRGRYRCRVCKNKFIGNEAEDWP